MKLGRQGFRTRRRGVMKRQAYSATSHRTEVCCIDVLNAKRPNATHATAILQRFGAEGQVIDSSILSRATWSHWWNIAIQLKPLYQFIMRLHCAHTMPFSSSPYADRNLLSTSNHRPYDIFVSTRWTACLHRNLTLRFCRGSPIILFNAICPTPFLIKYR